METENNSARNGQEVLQLTEWLARLVLERTGKKIDLNQSPFVDFLLRNQVTSIALVVLMPADGGRAAQIVYLDRNSAAVFQFPALDPLSFESSKAQPLRQENVRRDAPKEVRHHAGDEKQPDSFRGHAATLKSACIVDHTTLSPLEQSIAGRYIHAGEFAWLCLLWLWTGEPEDHPMMQVLDNRSVVLEQASDTKDDKGPLLLSKLCEIDGLKIGLEKLFGKLQPDEAGKYWKRSSNRLEDFEALGFLTSSSGSSKHLTKKARVFSDWIFEAVQVLVSEKNHGPKSPHNVERLQKLLNPAKDQKWPAELTRFVGKLRDACGKNDSAAWIEALNALLNAIPHQPPRSYYREMLRTDGFPVYPLVHMTMLFGLEAPLDWLAIPLGAMMDGKDSEDTCEHWPQAAAFVLALHRDWAMVGELVASLRPILTEIAFVESGSWGQQLLRKEKQRFADFSLRIADRFEGIIAVSPKTKKIVADAANVAITSADVLLLGETGTGKELVAKAIHQFSPRSQKQMVTVHCAGLPATLFEAELFGHEKGAFTGAHERRIGRIEQAQGGTLFLDEIGEFDTATQVKLLRVLGERTFERLGSNKTFHADVRLIAATNKSLEELVKEGKFRPDLFYRINTEQIYCPPLRERRDDILPMVLDFFRKKRGISGDMMT